MANRQQTTLTAQEFNKSMAEPSTRFGHWHGLWRTASIRTRLLLSFVLLVLLSVLAVSIASTVLAWQNGRARVIQSLELEVRFKEYAIQRWLDDLLNDFEIAYSDRDVVSFAEYLLDIYAQYPDEEDLTSQVVPFDLRRVFNARLQDLIDRTQLFEDMAVVDVYGRVVVETDTVEDPVLLAFLPHVQKSVEDLYIRFFALDGPHLVMAVPFFASNESGETIGEAQGYLIGFANMRNLHKIMRDKSALGETGDIYLVGRERVALSVLRFGAQQREIRVAAVEQAFSTQASGSGTYYSDRGIPVISVYHWLPQLQVALVAEQARAEAFRLIYPTLTLTVVISLIAASLAAVAALLVTRDIVRPLVDLADTATQIAAGDLDQVAHVVSRDEVGQLAQTFNSMTAQLRELFSGLEHRVAERTEALERRSTYLQVSAEIGRAASFILDADELIHEVVDLVRDRLDLYYVGLFLVEEEWAVLRAGTGAAGQAMLAREHRIRVGDGMIGWSIAHAQARVASHADADAVRLANPELPETRSELALPLHSRGQVLGAMSVQSTHIEAFDEVAITTLQTMADQVAVALDNARLFAESREALEAERRAYTARVTEAWHQLLRSREGWGYRYERQIVGEEMQTSLHELQDAWPVEMREVQKSGHRMLRVIEGTQRLLIPIWVGSEVIGALSFDKADVDANWTDEEVMLLENLADQLGQTLERAQLYWDTRERAGREQMTREVTDAMRRTVTWDELMQVALQEIGSILDASRAFVQWTPAGMIAPGTDFLASEGGSDD